MNFWMVPSKPQQVKSATAHQAPAVIRKVAPLPNSSHTLRLGMDMFEAPPLWIPCLSMHVPLI